MCGGSRSRLRSRLERYTYAILLACFSVQGHVYLHMFAVFLINLSMCGQCSPYMAGVPFSPRLLHLRDNMAEKLRDEEALLLILLEVFNACETYPPMSGAFVTHSATALFIFRSLPSQRVYNNHFYVIPRSFCADANISKKTKNNH